MIGSGKRTATGDVGGRVHRPLGISQAYRSRHGFWQTLGIIQLAGQTAVREPRATDRLEMLHDLLKLRKGSWDDALYRSIYSRAKLTEAKRNLVAHGKMGASRQRMARRIDTRFLAEKSPRPRCSEQKIMPQLIPMDEDKLREATSEIDGLIVDLKRLRASASGAPLPPPETRLWQPLGRVGFSVASKVGVTPAAIIAGVISISYPGAPAARESHAAVAHASPLGL
jgi:hypothetical protein